MKTKLLMMAAMLCASSHLFAQQSNQSNQGFYINPSLTYGPLAGPYGSHFKSLQPQLAFGYIWGDKNRHNLSISGLSGGLSKYYSSIGLNLKYSYDIRLWHNNRFSLFVSPYLNAGGSLMKSKDISHSGFYTKSNTYSVTAGVSPSLEYKAGKNTTFVFALPLNIFSTSHTQGSFMENGARTNYQQNFSQFRPRLGASVGLRINLGGRK